MQGSIKNDQALLGNYIRDMLLRRSSQNSTGKVIQADKMQAANMQNQT